VDLSERGGGGEGRGGVEELQMKRGSFFYGGPDYIFIGPVEWIQQATSISEARIGEKKKDQRTDEYRIFETRLQLRAPVQVSWQLCGFCSDS
jgi:hypothetical protein